MNKYKILGYRYNDFKKENLKVLCYMNACSLDEAIEKARNIYGRLQVVGAQPL